jgi:hypothetical protein
MIARIWRGWAATREKAAAYQRHVTGKVFPALPAVAGHRGALLLRREDEGRIEFLAMTLWASPEAIRGFAGDDIERAVVEPEARAVLAGFDDVARHYEVAHAAGLEALKG